MSDERTHDAAVAESCRIAAALGLVEPASVIMARTEDGTWSAAGTPKPLLDPDGAPAALCRPGDVVTLATIEDAPGALAVPADEARALAVFAARTAAPAVALLAPEPLLQLGAAGYLPRPVTHTNSELVARQLAMVPTEAYPWTDGSIDRAADSVSEPRGVLLGGLGVLVAGDDALDCVRRAFALYEIAKVDISFRRTGRTPREITVQESVELAAERPPEPVPSRPPWRMLRGYDPFRVLGEAAADAAVRSALVAVAPTTPDGVDAMLALACRTLAVEEDLVTYYEHVSMRLPPEPDGTAATTFAMSPAARYDLMAPADILHVRLHPPVEGVSGPYPPAPYRWFHSEVLRALDDVDAIVHTHAKHGRSLGTDVDRVDRFGRVSTVAALDGSGVVDLPTLNFLPDIRAAALDLLRRYRLVDIVTHGTDFVAPTMEGALGAAVARERMHRWAFELDGWAGTDGMAPDLLRAVAAAGPPASSWGAVWMGRRLAAELAAARQPASGSAPGAPAVATPR